MPADWFDRVVALQGPLCVVTRRRAQHAHHAFEVQWLASNGLGWLASDPRIGVPVTRRVHERHTLAVRRIPRRRLPPSVELVAFELGLEWYLERYYG